LIGIEGVRASPENKSDLLQAEKERNNYVKGTHRSFATTVSQFKICDFFQEKLLKVLKCYNFL
jgi:hypothetical protein